MPIVYSGVSPKNYRIVPVFYPTIPPSNIVHLSTVLTIVNKSVSKGVKRISSLPNPTLSRKKSQDHLYCVGVCGEKSCNETNGRERYRSDSVASNWYVIPKKIEVVPFYGYSTKRRLPEKQTRAKKTWHKLATFTISIFLVSLWHIKNIKRYGRSIENSIMES
ncbi:hypothetical protein K501DRAFT_274164 [Backusella circina FSU 941]|nr:hypothetical protein K501DRAFT_274164 [Backusella circina FSU 941]